MTTAGKDVVLIFYNRLDVRLPEHSLFQNNFLLQLLFHNVSPEERLLTRRRVLTTLSISTISVVTGCFSPQMGGAIAEIIVYNSTDSEVEVLLRVYRVEDEQRLINDTFVLASESSQEYEQPFSKDGRKRLEIVVDGSRRASHEWDARAERDSTGIDVPIQEERIDIDEVSR